MSHTKDRTPGDAGTEGLKMSQNTTDGLCIALLASEVKMRLIKNIGRKDANDIQIEFRLLKMNELIFFL